MAKIIDQTEKKSINLAILQKEDINIADIVGSASHVVIYRYDNSSCQWDRIGVEGAAFVVMASVAPLLRLVVLNRLGIRFHNLVFLDFSNARCQKFYA
jgi:mRNA-decapping enzyme 1B